jgi:transcriptional regulator with XRE-family HTH domain
MAAVDAPSRLLDVSSNMQDINARIAARVRAMRADSGLSLESLSGRCAVSRSMLSLIERGETSPTAVVLEKIATSLGCTLASLFDDANAPVNAVSHAGDRATWKDPQSGYTRRNISPANFPSPIRIVEVAFPAGARVSYETAARDAPVAQQIWVRDGSIEVTIGNVTHRLVRDDCLAMRLDAHITFRNRGRKTAHYVVVLCS